MTMEMSAIEHDPVRRQYVMHVGGERAFVDYVDRDGIRCLVHSEVPAALRGKGVGKVLVEGTFRHLTDDGHRARAVCSYIRAVAKRSATWREVIDH